MNNYNYLNSNWIRNGMQNDFFFPNINMNNQNTSLFSPKEGFEKGNMFSNLYSEYKNYKAASLNPKTEQQKMLRDLQAITFAAHDLNLYLDLNPTDQSMATLFNDYRRRKEELTREYEEKYGPMTVGSESMEASTFEWVNSPWPWEEENV